MMWQLLQNCGRDVYQPAPPTSTSIKRRNAPSSIAAADEPAGPAASRSRAGLADAGSVGRSGKHRGRTCLPHGSSSPQPRHDHARQQRQPRQPGPQTRPALISHKPAAGGRSFGCAPTRPARCNRSKKSGRSSRNSSSLTRPVITDMSAGNFSGPQVRVEEVDGEDEARGQQRLGRVDHLGDVQGRAGQEAAEEVGEPQDQAGRADDDDVGRRAPEVELLPIGPAVEASAWGPGRRTTAASRRSP